MKDFDLKKECEKADFSYDGYWEEDEEDRADKEISEMSNGVSRKGIKGKYLKVKGRVSKRQIKNSYYRGLRG